MRHDAVVKIADTTPPSLTGAGVNEAGLFIQLVFSENVQRSNLPPASAFTVTANGSGVTISGISTPPSLNALWIVVTPAIGQGQAIVVAYADPTAGDDANAIQDAAGNDVASFTTGMNGVPAATNISTAMQRVAPTITGSPTLSQSGSDGAWSAGATVEVTLRFPCPHTSACRCLDGFLPEVIGGTLRVHGFRGEGSRLQGMIGGGQSRYRGSGENQRNGGGRLSSAAQTAPNLCPPERGV